MRTQFGTVLRGVRRTLYRGPVETAVRSLGLKTALRDGYYKLLFTFGSDRVDAEVKGASARFEVRSLSEKSRASNVPGSGRPTLPSLIDEIRGDDVFFEIGANIGVISCLVGDRIETGQVVAFEPHPLNTDRLRVHFDNNDVPGSVYEVALSDEESEMDLGIDSSETGAGGHSISSDGTEDVLTVESKRGDSLVSSEGIPTPNVVYIDVEGAELRVIRGMRESLRSERCRLVHCSVHATEAPGANSIHDHGHTPEQLHEELESLGFDLERVETMDTDNYYVIARKDHDGR